MSIIISERSLLVKWVNLVIQGTFSSRFTYSIRRENPFNHYFPTHVCQFLCHLFWICCLSVLLLLLLIVFSCDATYFHIIPLYALWKSSPSYITFGHPFSQSRSAEDAAFSAFVPRLFFFSRSVLLLLLLPDGRLWTCRCLPGLGGLGPRWFRCGILLPYSWWRRRIR